MKTSQVLSEQAVKNIQLEDIDIKSFDDKDIEEVWTKYSDYSDFREKEFEERYSKWNEKIKDFFKYTIWRNVSDWWYNTKWFFHNIIVFRPILKIWRDWDYEYQVKLFKFGLEQLAVAIEHGHEVEESRDKKVKAIRELIAELEYDYEDAMFDKYKRGERYNEQIEKITKYKDGSVSFKYKESKKIDQENKRYFKAVEKARKDHYQKIFNLILGQDKDYIVKEVNKRYDALTEEEKKIIDKGKIYDELFDGSGIEGWWE